MTQESEGSRKEPWEREILEQLALETLAERRRSRRWNVFFRILFFTYLIVVTASLFKSWPQVNPMDEGKIAAMIGVKGMIMPDSPSSAEVLIKGLEQAANNEHTQGILLQMNSPGGSPVQAASVFEAIRRIKREKPDLPILAVIGDMCASGCYYIAAAADKIYVSPASIVGSIGVIMSTFGFVDAIHKLGVERRLLTAGEHKALMDPFSPVKSEEKAHIQNLLNEVHRQFIAAIKQGRGDRLKEDPDLFSGLVWTGSQSIELGLADGLGDVHSVAKNVIGTDRVIDFTPKEEVWKRLARKFGTSVGEGLGWVLTGGLGSLL